MKAIGLIVSAAGYLPKKELVNRALGSEIPAKIGPV